MLKGGKIMPILYENTDRMVKRYGGKVRKLSPSPDVGSFLVGVFTGFFVLPIVLSFIGYKLEKMKV
jgi:hypothetical protein